MSLAFRDSTFFGIRSFRCCTQEKKRFNPMTRMKYMYMRMQPGVCINIGILDQNPFRVENHVLKLTTFT